MTATQAAAGATGFVRVIFTGPARHESHRGAGGPGPGPSAAVGSHVHVRRGARRLQRAAAYSG